MDIFKLKTVFVHWLSFLRFSLVYHTVMWFCCRGSRCGGCRRVNDSERPYAFEVQLYFAFFRSISATLRRGPFFSITETSAIDFGFHCFVLDCS